MMRVMALLLGMSSATVLAQEPAALRTSDGRAIHADTYGTGAHWVCSCTVRGSPRLAGSRRRTNSRPPDSA